MTRRKTRKLAYSTIVKEHKPHQEVFDELRETSSLDAHTLALEVAKIPSLDKSQRQQSIRYVFVGLMVLIVLVRLISVLGLLMAVNIVMSAVVISVLVGLVVPIMGFIAVFASKVDLYRSVAIWLGISVFRSVSKNGIPTEPLGWLLMIPFVAAIALALYIPTKLKTSYTVNKIKKEVDGKEISSSEYVFDTTKSIRNEDLLDEI